MRRIAFLGLVFPAMTLAQAPFEPGRVVARTDSFAVMVQGRQVGGIRETIEKTPTGFRLLSVQALAGMSQSTEVHFTRALVMSSVKQEGQARGQQMKIDVAYDRGRAKGSATTPGPQGMKTIAVDTVVPAGAVDDNVLQALLPALPLGEGKSFQVPVFASGQGTSRVMTVAVNGRESVTVPAGTFDAWKVEVMGGQVPVTFWVSRTAPRVVKMGFAGAPMAFELVK
ncbi:MAG: DUF3108 domain-containing protein [Gemmatimonadetes bacterium]|nr:DUF3108 domain-containing protein [Gemmatimonadota bacterium]